MSLKPGKGSFIEELLKHCVKENAINGSSMMQELKRYRMGDTVLTNYNASSIAVKAIMDALKIVSAAHPKEQSKYKTYVLDFIYKNRVKKSGEPLTSEAMRRLIQV